MFDQLISIVTLCGAIGSGLVAGLMFTFSSFMMTVLGRLPAAQGIATMQSINVAILNPAFGLLFFGTTASTLLVAVTAPFTTELPGAGWRLAGGLLFVIGAFLVTMLANVPLNNALDKVDPASATGAKVWKRYLATWTAWNHVRTLTAGGAATTLTIAVQW